MKMVKNGHFLHQPDTPTFKRRSARIGVELRLGRPEIGFMLFSGLPRCSNAQIMFWFLFSVNSNHHPLD